MVVLGGAGMLGTDVCRVCGQRGYSVTALDLPEFDITDAAVVEQAIETADVVVNCAAYTNVDGAESEQDIAYAVNAEAVGQLGRIIGRLDKWVLHVGTDFVFDGGGDRPWTEDDQPNPVNVYGASKLAGEKLLGESGCDNCIVRVEWTYGRAGNNFVRKLLQVAKGRQQIKVVADQIGSPTSTLEAAEVIFELAQQQLTGLYHFAAAGYVSRYEMAKFVFEQLGVKTEVVPCGSDQFPSPAKRPLNSRFCCDKIRKASGVDIKNWQEPLRRYLETL